MSAKKHFAKTLLAMDKKLSIAKDTALLLTISLSTSMATTVIGVTITEALERDAGNEYATEIYQQYDQYLNNLSTAKKDFLSKYAKDIEKSAKTADITSAMNDFNSAITTSFWDDNDVDNPKQSEEWKQFLYFSKLFADNVVKDDKLSESDAEDLIERLENDIISFKELGYTATPDAGDLRECQAIFDTPLGIAQCSVEDDYINPELKNQTALSIFTISMLLGFAFPLGVVKTVEKNRKTLENWTKNKKNPQFKH